MKIFQGISSSVGISQGYSYVISRKEQHTIPKIKIAESEREPGWNRFKKSIASISKEYKNLIDEANSEQGQVIQSYLLMLSDSEFIGKIKRDYQKSNFNVEHIVKQNVDEVAANLRALGDEYLKERALDIEDVFEKVLFNMLGYSTKNVDDVPENAIVIVEKLTPSEAMTLFKKNIGALVMQEGGVSSHISILARTYGVPTIFGIENPCSIIENNKLVIVDAAKSLVIVEPDLSIQNDYKAKIEAAEKKNQELRSFAKMKGQTKDGTPIKIFANISSVEDAKLAQSEGADGIGLFRTEFLFMNGKNHRLPTEEEQFRVYSEILDFMGSKPVTIRTLDAGGDKIVSELSYDEKNPLLGCRAIRLCLNNKDIFVTQLRALYRASVHGNLKILLPMITSKEQIVQTKKIIEQVKKKLTAEGLSFVDKVPLGIMIETPAAAVCSDILCNECDFFSIGSNDLTQYMLAVDRENINVSSLYDELHPAILRMIRHTVISATQANIDISVCGEMAARKETLKILVGLGIRNLSVNPKSITEVKRILSKNSITEMETLAESRFFLKTIK